MYDDRFFRAVPFAGQAGDFLKLADFVEAPALLAVLDNLEPMPFQLGDGIQLRGARGVEIDQDVFSSSNPLH